MRHSGLDEATEGTERRGGMKYERAEIFSSGTEYEIFKYNYCENGCIHHVEREEDGFPALLEDGGCPIEDGMECARFNAELFPNVLLRVVDGDKYVKWHHCPFYRKAVRNDNRLYSSKRML